MIGFVLGEGQMALPARPENRALGRIAGCIAAAEGAVTSRLTLRAPESCGCGIFFKGSVNGRIRATCPLAFSRRPAGGDIRHQAGQIADAVEEEAPISARLTPRRFRQYGLAKTELGRLL